MSESRSVKSCGRCGAELRSRNAEGLCVRCLLESGFEAPQDSSHLRPGGEAADNRTVRFFGDYELLDEIARGGMGIVYRARQTKLGRTVALKMMLGGQFASREVIRRFRAEVTTAALLQHPNIVAIHDVGVQEDQHYFSMDFVQGQNLSQLVGVRPLASPIAARYVRIVAEAIHYAHEQGILHRDLKPSNVLIDSASDQPCVTDFGLAKRLDGESSLTITGQVLGSPNFMPPEQTSSRRGGVGRHSDVYGLGAILYHLLTARPPFQAESFEGVINQVLNTEPVSPRLLNSSVPRDLETICLKCLQKEPHHRYRTAQELADELSRFSRKEPIHARPISRVERTWRWCRRKPAIASLAAATMVLLLAVIIGFPVAFVRIDRERQRAEENLYAADMHGAGTALEDGDLGLAREKLEAHRPRVSQPDLRGFEWRLFLRRCRGDDLYALRGYSNALNALKFSPDGNTLATRTRDNQLKVWDLISRTERFTLTNVTALGEFASNGRKIIFGMGDGSVIFCDTETGRTLHSLEKAGELVGLLNDGRTIATTGKEFIVKFWDTISSKETFILPGKGGIDLWGQEFGAGIVITPDGKKLAISNGLGRGVTLWDLTRRKILTDSLDQRPMNPLTFLQLSPNGKVLAIGGFDGLVRFWDTATGEELLPAIQAHAEPVVSAAFSPDSEVFATASLDQTIKLWSFATRRELDTLKGHESAVRSVAFSADGKRLASGGLDKTVRLWNGGRKLAEPVLSNLVNEPIWSPDSKLMASRFQDGTVRLWDVATLETRAVLPGASSVLAFGDDGKTIVALFANGSVKYCDVATGNVVREGPKAPSGDWDSILVSPDGRRVARTDKTPTIQLWDIASGKTIFLTGQTNANGVLAFSGNSQTLITRGLPSQMCIWDVERRQHVRSIDEPTAQIFSAAISSDGTMVASGNTDNTIKLWSLKTGEWLATLIGHKRPAWALAFSPDGKTLASGSGDQSIRLWNVALRREVAILRSPDDGGPHLPKEIRSLSFSPDGNTLSAVTANGDLKLFRAATLDEARPGADAKQAPSNGSQ